MLQSSNIYFLINTYERFLDKIKSLGKLPKGWHYGEGIAPKGETIKEAVKIANYAHNNFLLIDAAPGLEGEVQLALYHERNKENQYIECTFEGNKTYNITIFRKQNNKWGILKDRNVESLKDIELEIDNFVREIFLCQITSESYQKDNFSQTSEDLEASPLKSLKVEFLLSENHAFQTPDFQYASI